MIHQHPDEHSDSSTANPHHEDSIARECDIHDTDHTVVILADDCPMLTGLETLLGANGYKVRTHTQVEDFLQVGPPDVPACLLLDNQLGNGITGLQVHMELQNRGCNLRTVFLATEWTVQSVVTAMRAGADNFLIKPVNPAELLESVAQALKRARTLHRLNTVTEDYRSRAATLTERERQIIRLVVAGHLNKEIADQLDLALVTVKVHRGKAMKKLRVSNPAELARVVRLTDI